MEKHLYTHRFRHQFSITKIIFSTAFFLALIVFFSLHSLAAFTDHRFLHGGPGWKILVKRSVRSRFVAGDLRVLVTGAAGFVGTHVSAALKRRGDGVVGIDNFNSFYDPSLKRARRALLKRAGVHVVEGDINDAALLHRLFKLGKFTHVMHLAGQGGEKEGIENPASYVHSNIAGLVSVLEVCKSANPQPAIVWASSSSVYGLNSKVPFTEKDRTDRPSTLYAASKKAGEEISHTYNHIYGLSITGLRFFTVYGPWGRPDMSYSIFTRNILQGEPISIHEDPENNTIASDFTYIDDIVEGCLGALDTAKKSTGKRKRKAQFRVFNLGNTYCVSKSDIVSALERSLKMKAKRIVYARKREGKGNGFRHANISLAEMEIGYKPRTDLQTGLKKFVKWYLKYYSPSGRAMWGW